MAFCLHPHHCPWGTLAWHREGLGLMRLCDPRGSVLEALRGASEGERGLASDPAALSMSPEHVCRNLS